MAKKILLPIPNAGKSANGQQNGNPAMSNNPISIETALIYGGADSFYNIID